MNGVTRECAVQTLMSLEDRILLRLEYASSHLEYVRQSQIGDNFFVRFVQNEMRDSRIILIVVLISTRKRKERDWT